jgi:hypothetical protein
MDVHNNIDGQYIGQVGVAALPQMKFSSQTFSASHLAMHVIQRH